MTTLPATLARLESLADTWRDDTAAEPHVSELLGLVAEIRATIDQPEPLIIATVVEGDMLDENGELDHEWTLYRAGDLILTCPHPECLSHAFYEVDRSERWNELMVEDGGLHVHQGDGDYETIGWRCQACGGMCDLPYELASEVSWS